MGSPWNGLNRNKRPRTISPRVKERNGRWKALCIERAQYLIDKYGFLICEYSGEAIRHLTSTFNSPEDAWGHHRDGNRNNCTAENVYIVKYKYHQYITEHHIDVEQEDFQGRSPQLEWIKE